MASKAVGQEGATLYGPLDLRVCVRRALKTLQPRILLLMESELWPVLIHLTKARGVPVVVINGRVSRRAFRHYLAVGPWLRGMLDRIDRFLMQSQVDADRIIQLGVSSGKVRVVGSLKWEASVTSRPTPTELQQLAAHLGLNSHEQIIVAGSTHRGEEAAVLRAVVRLRAGRPALRVILAPRHLERIQEVEGLVRQAGLTPTRCSRFGVQQAWDVGIVDAFGQLPRYYGLATVAFVGGSLIPHGGQNPLEPASLGKPIVFGPSMHNFAEIARQLLTHCAAVQVRSGAELIPTLEGLLAQPEAAASMGSRALQLIEQSQGACQRTLDALAPLLTLAR